MKYFVIAVDTNKFVKNFIGKRIVWTEQKPEALQFESLEKAKEKGFKVFKKPFYILEFDTEYML